MNFFHRKGEVPFFTSSLFHSSANLFDRLFLVIVVLSLLTFQSFAQSNEWMLSAEKDGVKIYQKIDECGEMPIVLLRFENSRTQKVLVKWNEYAKLEGMPGEFKLMPDFHAKDFDPGTHKAADCTDLSKIELISSPNAMFLLHHTRTTLEQTLGEPEKKEIESFRIEIQEVIIL